MSETVILITVISSAILSPFLNYLYNSRCRKISCCCINCEREIVDNDNNNNHDEITQIPNSNVKNKNQL